MATMNYIRKIGVSLLILSCSLPSFGHTYQEAPVTNGGTLSGTITLNGKIPKPKGYNLVTFPDPVFCGRISNGKGWRLLQPFNIGPNGEFRDVVVLVEGIEAGKPLPDTTPKIEAVDCLFKPFITVVRDKHKVEVVNMDPVFHDIQAYETSKLGARVLFNTPLPMNKRYSKSGITAMSGKHKRLAGKPISQKIRMNKGRRIFVMQCGFHAYMESWGLAINHPYFDQTTKDGRFEIGDIPPGDYRVMVWHPVIKAGKGQFYDVTIKPNGSTSLDISLDAPRGRLYVNQIEENPRFGISLMGDQEIIPSVELQTY